MNVIISNKAENILSSLQIDVIKKVQGEFSANEIISMFGNFFYQRMILDITAIKDYKDIKNIQNLTMHLDVNKLILFLDDSVEASSPEYVSKLISMGIYNFIETKTLTVFYGNQTLYSFMVFIILMTAPLFFQLYYAKKFKEMEKNV